MIQYCASCHKKFMRDAAKPLNKVYVSYVTERLRPFWNHNDIILYFCSTCFAKFIPTKEMRDNEIC